ncbi:M23 family metallopeptidase [Caldimonas brevitalea]|uniref:M23ase beta-sheet core domain-containing protein n=1 Tax=Caldimonas brevitalea TaxID=413882 RepID=A0A0G3BQX6_9BURK|nr:M23 family metallopeptidase [Caldimonas brevitalea]AKJ31819.1 hypothetical protein AAW51_5128 [Caldimonas brevitalea]
MIRSARRRRLPQPLSRPIPFALALLLWSGTTAQAAECTPRGESRRDPNTGQSWGQVWQCGSDSGATLYAGPQDTTPVGTLQTRSSWFACYRRGERHAGGNDVWYYTQGDVAAPGWESRKAWGYVPAVKVSTTTDPYPGIPECRPDMWQARKNVSDPNTGKSWSTVWYANNDGAARLYREANSNTHIGYLDSTTSYFVCHTRGATHAGGNNVWYYTQGDRSTPGHEARRGWGYLPAVNTWTRQDPYDSIPPCDGAAPPSPPPPPQPGPYVLPLPLDAFNRAIGALGHAHWGDNYWAIDLMVPVGTPVYSVSAGKVSNYSQGSCGNGLTVLGDDGLSYLYCHGDRYAGVQPGQRVTAGQLILYSGNTGQSGAPHLHLEIKRWNGDWGASPSYCSQRFLRAIHQGQPQSPVNFPAQGDCRAP